MSSSINLASGLAPVAEISDSNDGQVNPDLRQMQ